MKTPRQHKWDRDISIEAMASEFLDKNFYPAFSKKHIVTRHKDTQHQFAGIDVTIDGVKFDEKCKCYGCLNDILKYVSFEVSLDNKSGFVSDGWFASSKTLTDIYAFVGLSATVDDVTKLSDSSQITAADIVWVKKQDLVDYIEQNGSSVQSLKEDAETLRNDADGIEAFGGSTYNGKHRHSYEHRKFWLTYSTHLRERPVNLVLTRDTLLSLPHTKHFIATKEGVKIV